MILLAFTMLVSMPIHTKADGDLLPKVYTKDELVQKVYTYADEYNVSPKTMINVINCEDVNWDIKLQSELHYKQGNRWGFPAGTQEKSFGLVQIHLPDHPDITLQQAYDPDYSLNFLASNLAKGKGEMWSCYRK